MITKYRTGGCGKHPIEKLEVERETKASVWINSRRNSKVSDWYNYFDTWDEAKAHLLQKAENKLSRCRQSLAVAQGERFNVKELKNPYAD